MERSHDLAIGSSSSTKLMASPLVYNHANVYAVNTEKYQVYTAEEWLIHFNRSVRN